MTKKILAAFLEDGVHSGTDRYLMGAQALARENGVQMDFLTSRYTPELEKALSEKGSRLFSVPSLKNPIAQFRAVEKILSEEKYDKVYLNLSEPLNCAAAMAAKKAGVGEILLHSHSSGIDRKNKLSRTLRGTLNFLCRPLLYRCGTGFYSCSDVAAAWLFPKKALREGKIELIENAVDFSRFSYSEKKRKKIRRELSIADDEKMLLFAGHFCYAKNNAFLIDVFFELQKKKPNTKLVLVGVGAELDACREKVKNLGLEDKALFLGVRHDMDSLFSAADLFLLPSRFEGLPIVAVEAQANGVITLLSDRITKEAKISDAVFFLPITDAKIWAEKAEELLESERKGARIESGVKLRFDFDSQKEALAKKLFS